MAFPLAGMIGGSLFSRLGFSAIGSRFTSSPLIQGGTFGVGYTGGAYAGYGVSNTWDPLRLHQTYKHPQSRQFRMPYGRSYGRRRYNGYSGYTRYSRRSYYRRRRPYYRRRSYY